MAWIVSATDTDKKHNGSKNIDSQTGSVDALVGRKIEKSTEEAKARALAKSKGRLESFYLCTDPTCKAHIDVLGDVVRWKLKYASDREYSDEDMNRIADKKRRESIRDYRTVTKNVKEIYDTKSQSTTGNNFATGTSTDPEITSVAQTNQSQAPSPNKQTEGTRPQQLGSCECGKQQKPTQITMGETTTEQQSNKDINGMVHSLRASISAIPMVNVDVGGTSKSSDETTSKEKSTFNTRDIATFPICPDLACEEHLITLGLIESWKLRRDSSREYSDEAIDETVREVLTQEIRGNQILTENAEVVFEEMVGNSREHKPGVESTDDELESSLSYRVIKVRLVKGRIQLPSPMNGL